MATDWSLSLNSAALRRHVYEVAGWGCFAGIKVTWLATHCQVWPFLIQVSTKR